MLSSFSISIVFYVLFKKKLQQQFTFFIVFQTVFNVQTADYMSCILTSIHLKQCKLFNIFFRISLLDFYLK